MRKRFYLLLVATLAFMSVNARQISEQEAQLKAEKFFGKQGQNHSNMRRAPRKAPKLMLASNREELYIFNDEANGGYVVISGDDRMPEVLAYSYDGLYDDNDIPDNMKAWMDDYAAQVAYLKSHPEAEVKRQTATERENIEPFLTCWFAQGAPYNDKCPEVDDKRCPTGCVATAMAQIMYYYQWPKQTTEVIPEYTTHYLGISMPEQPITTIDWDNIRGEYRNNYRNEEADAVSTLMLLCGSSVNMDYDPDGSGAGSPDKALRNYFGYDDLLEVVSRDYYSVYYNEYYNDLNMWEDLIYNELDEGRPVYYSGYSETIRAGHAFIMDGYKDGYFHVNWGWGGAYSYVLMTDVGGFNLYHTAIVGIQPDYPDTPSRYAVYEDGKMTLYYDTEKEQRSGIVISHKDDWVNYANDITACVIDPSFANLRQRSLEYYFYRWEQLRSIEGIENLRTDNVIDMGNMFYACSSLSSLDVSGFKTDNVTDMGHMFSGCSSLTSLDVSGFKTDNVRDMGSMFIGCSSLTSLDVSGFKTDNVKVMGGMFYGCSNLTSLDLNSFNTEKVWNMQGMFSLCSSLTSLDLSSFNTENVRYMDGMFDTCINLKKIYVGSGWTTVNVTEGKNMFYGCLKLVGGAGTIYDGQHRDYTYAHIDGGATNPGYFRDINLPDPPEPYAVLSNDNTVLTFYYDDQMETRGGMYVESRGVVVIYEREWESHSNDITTVVFDESFSRCETLTNTAYWFIGCSKLKNIVGIENLNTEHVTDMEYMFRGCSSLTSLDVSGFKTDNVTNMHDMFLSCSSLTSLDVSGFMTDNVTNMGSMFSGCSRLTSLDVSGFKTDNVTRIDGMFSGCSRLTSLDVSGFNTANVTDMNGMFSGCSSLTSLDLSSFKTDKVTNMSHMFSDCSSLKKIFVSAEWTTNNVTSGDNMFSGCSQLMGSAGTIYDGNHSDYTYAHIDGGTANPGYLSNKNSFYPYAHLSEDNSVLSFYYDDQMESRGGMDVYYERQWLKHSDDIITVVFDKSFADCTTLTSMSVWFSGCSKLKSIVGLNNLRTDNVTDMNQMFGECSSLTSLDLSSFKTENVTDMGYMFYGCSGLTSLDLSSFKTDNVTNMSYMFYGCSGLTSLDLSSFKTANVTSMDNMFYGCRKLKRIYVGSEWTINNVTSGEYMFNGCSKLIGGAGTKYEWGLWDYTYAHIDGGTDNPGYFRDINIPYFEPYALLTKDNTILTFYYDDQMESRGGMDVYEQPWRSLSGDIITVVFDETFASCTSLTSTANWFEDCSNLKDIIGIENLRTGNVTDMYSMFYRCSSLTSLDLSSFNTANVTNMSWMFYNCENLKTIYVREGWNTSKVKNSNSMFGGCLKLEGGSGTTYNDSHITANYAHIDGGVANPGYLTYKDTYKTIIYMVDGEEYKSYRLEIGKDIIPEPKPTKDGYVFIGWNDIPATMPDHDVVVTGAFYPYGDVNTDKDVDVLDVVDIARYVVEIPSESFVMQLADINKDGNVNLGDAVTLVNEIAGEQNFVRAKASPKDNYINDVLSLTEWNGSLSLNLQNERYYTAFQFDLYVPEGSDVTQMSLNTKRKQGHQLLYNRVKDGHYRVAALSTSNNEFIGNDGELLIVALNGLYNNEVSIRNIHFFDVKGNDYQFDDIYGSTVTSVRQIDNGKLIIENSIYDLQGRKRLALQRGVNIVGGNKVIVK